MIDEMRAELKTQDCRCTSHPLFVVYANSKIPTSEDYSKEWEYCCTDEYESIGRTKKDLVKFAKKYGISLCKDEMYTDEDVFNHLQAMGYRVDKIFYIEVKEFKEAFFTEKAAQEYVDAHKWQDSTLYICVESMYDNLEMRELRIGILEGKIREV